MWNTQRMRILLATVVGSALIFGVMAMVQASRNETLLAYLPVVFDYQNGPAATPTLPPPPTPTPTATPVPRHFDDCAFRTGGNATIAVTADVPISGDFAFAVDDEIAIFNPAGSICAGMTPWSGKNIAITAWGDDDQTDEIDGLLSGEQMSFRIWDKSANREIEVTAATYSVGNGIFEVDSIHVVSSLTIE